MSNELRHLNANELERITRSQFCENFDSIIARVSKEKIGFIISDEGKDDIVLWRKCKKA